MTNEQDEELQSKMELHLLDAINDPTRVQRAMEILSEEALKSFAIMAERLFDEGFSQEEIVGLLNSAFGFAIKPELLGNINIDIEEDDNE